MALLWPPDDTRYYQDHDIDWPYYPDEDDTEWEDWGQEQYENERSLEEHK